MTHDDADEAEGDCDFVEATHERLTLATYRKLMAALPRPTQDQVDAFIDHV